MGMTAREAFDHGTDAFNAHDMEAFAETVADDVVTIAPGGMRAEGKDACIAFFRNWIEAFPDAHVDVHLVVDDGETIVEEGTFSGTHDGTFHSPMGDVPATGRSLNAEYIQVLRFRDGKTVSGHLLFDRVDMLEQLGLMPAPAGA